MKIAIHNREDSFSGGWISYCDQHHIDYIIVDAYSSDIVQQVKGCDAFMWHFHHADYRDMEFAKGLLRALETAGVVCFPDSNTCWHFDNKVFQKYLLEAIDAPLVPSYVFYTKNEALDWARKTLFPKVFKLKGGAGATNVMLVHNVKEAESLIRRCFGRGFRQYRWPEKVKDSFKQFKAGKNSIKDVLRPIKYAFRKYPTEFDHYHSSEIGYAYFQDFVPNNDHDTRVVVIGGSKAMAEVRYVREGDFRASGSGKFAYGNVDENAIRIAFDVARRLRMQSVAFDFVENHGVFSIIEISYGFGTHGISNSGGYWTEDLCWHNASKLDYAGWMVEMVLDTIRNKELD